MSNTDTENSENQKSHTQNETGCGSDSSCNDKGDNANPSTSSETSTTPEENYKEKYIYLIAETDNLKKRLERKAANGEIC